MTVPPAERWMKVTLDILFSILIVQICANSFLFIEDVFFFLLLHYWNFICCMKNNQTVFLEVQDGSNNLDNFWMFKFEDTNELL